MDTEKIRTWLMIKLRSRILRLTTVARMIIAKQNKLMLSQIISGPAHF